MKKGYKIYSILNNLCPRCHTASFWKYNNPYKNIFISNHYDIGRCENCKLKFELEPGFWFGAMYVSYAISVFIFLLTWFCFDFFFNEMDIKYLIISNALILFILTPVTYFFSRLIWINFFIHYDSKF